MALNGSLLEWGQWALWFEYCKLQLAAKGLLWMLLPALEIVNMTGNLFGGKIYPSVKNCTNLTYHGAGNNLFEGTLPSELGLLTNLVEMVFSGNVKLGGSLPAELGRLSNLRHVDITDTSMTGDWPEEFCREQELEGRVQVVDVTASCSSVQCSCG